MVMLSQRQQVVLERELARYDLKRILVRRLEIQIRNGAVELARQCVQQRRVRYGAHGDQNLADPFRMVDAPLLRQRHFELGLRDRFFLQEHLAQQGTLQSKQGQSPPDARPGFRILRLGRWGKISREANADCFVMRSSYVATRPHYGTANPVIAPETGGSPFAG